MLDCREEQSYVRQIEEGCSGREDGQEKDFCFVKQSILNKFPQENLYSGQAEKICKLIRNC